MALGKTLSMIGKLLGHNEIDTTARYAYLARDSILASLVRVADSIGADTLDESEHHEAAAPAGRPRRRFRKGWESAASGAMNSNGPARCAALPSGVWIGAIPAAPGYD